VELCPERWQSHYDVGLFYKTRGRFAAGQAANQAAFDLGGGENDGVLWNLGICATGAGDGGTALRIWKGMGQQAELGLLGLPEGGYGSVKVRLAQRPLAERDPSREPDDPGAEETVWIERLSPCHGIIRSALFGDEIGVEYGDVVLIDGAPITHHTYGFDRIPVFPHLSTLARRQYRVFTFVATQRMEGQVADLSASLPEDSVLYVHSEQVVVQCQQCWETPGVDHAEHVPMEQQVVKGKLCAPPSVEPAVLLGQLDHAVGGEEGVQLLVPELCNSAGFVERAQAEQQSMRTLETVS